MFTLVDTDRIRVREGIPSVMLLGVSLVGYVVFHYGLTIGYDIMCRLWL